MLGGVITILAGGVIGVSIILNMMAMFSRSHYNLDLESQLIKAYIADVNGALHFENTTCR